MSSLEKQFEKDSNGFYIHAENYQSIMQSIDDEKRKIEWNEIRRLVYLKSKQGKKTNKI